MLRAFAAQRESDKQPGLNEIEHRDEEPRIAAGGALGPGTNEVVGTSWSARRNEMAALH